MSQHSYILFTLLIVVGVCSEILTFHWSRKHAKCRIILFIKRVLYISLISLVLEIRSVDKLCNKHRTNRHLLFLFARVATFTSNWIGTKMIDFPAKSHSYQANFPAKTLKLQILLSRERDFWVLVPKLAWKLYLFAPNQFELKEATRANKNTKCLFVLGWLQSLSTDLISTINKTEMNCFALVSTIYEPSGWILQFINLGQDLSW